MAENLDDGEFWLPSQFLTDTDDDTSTNSTNGFNSESVTETESDEDELLSEITRQMALHYIIPDPPASPIQKGLVLSSEGGSSRGSPTGPLSPAPAPAKMDYFKVGQPQKGTGYFDSNRVKHTNPSFHGYFPHQSAFSQQQLQTYQFQKLWSQEMMLKQQNQLLSNSRPNIPNRPLGLSPAAWPPLQHPPNRQIPAPTAQNHLPGSGMRAVFLGNPGAKRESTGTGVFLPRRVNPTENRKNTAKPGCSTVLVPEKVVQALNNINAAAAQSRSPPHPRPDTIGKPRVHNNVFHGPKRNTANAEIRLPSEWTY